MCKKKDEWIPTKRFGDRFISDDGASVWGRSPPLCFEWMIRLRSAQNRKQKAEADV
jgi:hypothetical protein